MPLPNTDDASAATEITDRPEGLPSLKPKARSNLYHRIVSALIAVPAVVAAFLYGGSYVRLLPALAGAVMVFEWSRMNRFHDARMYAAIAGLALSAQGWHLPGWTLIGCGGLYGIWRDPRAALREAAGLFYICGAIQLCLGMANMVVLQLLLLVWMTDTGAYITGKLLGGPKLAPGISPNKTWAGFFGGSLAGAMTGVLGAGLSADTSPATIPGQILFFLFLSLCAHGGDLLESACKRRCGIKDSGGILPGHGGMLDRLDSLLGVTYGYALIKALG